MSVLAFTRASDIEPRRRSWLWQGYLPEGAVALFDGDPGSAKSTVLLDLAARITTGRAWPDGSAAPSGSVLFASAEDEADDTIIPRFIAAEGDRSRLFIATPETFEIPKDSGVPALVEWLRANDVRLVIIDPVETFLPPGADPNKQTIRKTLVPLRRLASESGAVIALIRHLNKGDSRTDVKAIYRGSGSMGIVGVARVSYLVAAEPDDENAKVLAPVKMNLGPKPPALAFGVVVRSLADLGEQACIEWRGRSAFGADQLVRRVRGDDERETIPDTLRDLLEEGERPALEVTEEVQRQHGVSARTVRRHAKKIGVIMKKDGFRGESLWSLPSANGRGRIVLPIEQVTQLR